jgi:plastocyanin
VHRSRPTGLIGILLALTLALTACSAGDGGESADGGGGGDGATVSLSGSQFTPSSITIQAGETVTFTDTSSHTVTEGSNGEAVDDPIVDEQGGSDIEVTFDEPGTYNITCKIHSSMNMTVTVEG